MTGCRIKVRLNLDSTILSTHGSVLLAGYANEVGEAFRSQVHVNWVRATYGVASLYICADAADKGKQADQVF